MEKKITKKDYFAEIVTILEGADRADLAKVMQHEIELLTKKADTAKAKAAEKKSKGDGLTNAVKAVLTDELCTIAEIAEKVEFEGATVAQVQYRLNQLVNNGYASKAQVKVGEGTAARKLMAYAVAAADEN